MNIVLQSNFTAKTVNALSSMSVSFSFKAVQIPHERNEGLSSTGFVVLIRHEIKGLNELIANLKVLARRLHMCQHTCPLPMQGRQTLPPCFELLPLLPTLSSFCGNMSSINFPSTLPFSNTDLEKKGATCFCIKRSTLSAFPMRRFWLRALFLASEPPAASSKACVRFGAIDGGSQAAEAAKLRSQMAAWESAKGQTREVVTATSARVQGTWWCRCEKLQPGWAFLVALSSY